MSARFPKLDEFTAFIKERWAIHQRRLAGAPPPWTADPILQTYRFTNVRREDDRVTKWIHREWLRPHETDYDTIVFAMALARLVNLPSMLEVLGYPARWNAHRFVASMETRRAHGERSFNNAYMINAVGAAKGQSKAAYLAVSVLTPLWEKRRTLGAFLQHAPTLHEIHSALLTFHGFGGGFMAAQVAADVKWTPAGRMAADWETFAASGPGSRRGLNWVCGCAAMDRWRESEWHDTLLALRGQVLPRLPKELQSLDAQNLQNCLCEFSKYCKVKYAGGRAKQYFTPSEERY